MNKETIFVFKGYADDIYCDINGVFYSLKDQKEIQKKYYNGCMCINYNKKRYGLNKLRKFAKRKQIEIKQCPF